MIKTSYMPIQTKTTSAVEVVVGHSRHQVLSPVVKRADKSYDKNKMFYVYCKTVDLQGPF